MAQKIETYTCVAYVWNSSKDVENGTGSKLGAGWADMGHRGVMHGGHHEADAAALQRFFNNVCANHDVDSKFAERVGRA